MIEGPTVGWGLHFFTRLVLPRAQPILAPGRRVLHLGLPGGRNGRCRASVPRCVKTPGRFVTGLSALGLIALAAPLSAQTETWNDDRVLDLVERSMLHRQSVAVDSAFRNYQTTAEGFVYFFIERPGEADRVLVKADQIALDVYWQAPDQTRQTIVGERDEKLLPTRIRYHLDHLTVVQDDFGDYIRIGDGDEVGAVLHPMAPTASSYYDYQLRDSLSLTHSDGRSEVRVYEILVRPKDLDGPGYVGAVFVDRDRAAIVRMNFSFTASSYVDDTLDYIRISLDNSLWLGEYWLPYRQETEIRRETPFLDFMAGSVIRQRFRVGPYDFNVDIPPVIFRGGAVGALSPNRRARHDFERDLFDDLEDSGGLRPSPAIEEVEEQVKEAVAESVLSGLPSFRFHGAGLSDFARFNRAEGFYLGAGAALRAPLGTEVRAAAGYAFGREAASATLTLNRRGNDPTAVVHLAFEEPLDFGGFPGATPLENTMTTASGEKDYFDLFYRTGVGVGYEWGEDRTWSIQARWEEHEGAMDVLSVDPERPRRPVRSIEEGRLVAARASGLFGLTGGRSLRTTAEVGRFESRTVLSANAEANVPVAGEGWSGHFMLAAGASSSNSPPQQLSLLGGRHTLPGHEYRLFAGNLYWLARAEGTVPVVEPWFGIRAFVALGSTHLTGTPPADWMARDSQGLRGSVGLGVSLGWDIMRIDVGRAVWGTGWEAVASFAPAFRHWL